MSLSFLFETINRDNIWLIVCYKSLSSIVDRDCIRFSRNHRINSDYVHTDRKTFLSQTVWHFNVMVILSFTKQIRNLYKYSLDDNMHLFCT